jgi:hypothetical protein
MVGLRMSAQRLSLAHLWQWYAANVYGGYSPLNSAIAAAVASDPVVLERLSETPPPSHDPNLLLAAVHYLVLEGSTHPLAAQYEQEEPDNGIGALFRDFLLSQWQELREMLETRHVQTNECGRCPVLAVAIIAAAESLGEPLALVDAGASAGLNLWLDEYLLDFGPLGSIGPDTSPVRITCDVRTPGLTVAGGLPSIAHRAGLDRDPVDLTDPARVRWLLACTWPGTGRQARTSAAIELARSRPRLVRAGDIVDDLPSVLDDAGDRPVVVVTSWSYSYLPPERRPDFEARLRDAARRRPVAWVCCDGVGTADHLFVPGRRPPADRNPSMLGLAVFGPGGRVDSKVLAFVHPHGTWMEPLASG